jgi:uncharacterized protein with PIN domain
VIVEIRFHAELDELVAPAHRGRSSEVDVAPGTTVKDLAESLGVPHTEIDVILVNGRSVDFAYRLAPGDRVAVYPGSEALDVTPIVRLLPAPQRPPRFVLDVHLGRLARYLRLLGFDCHWRNDADDVALVSTAIGERRTLLTRDRGILKRSALTSAYYVREREPRRQALEVLRRFDLADAVKPFGRCLECNGVLVDVAKKEVDEFLPPRVRKGFDDFRRCEDCRRVYWKGSHYVRLHALVDDLLARRPEHGPVGG